MKSPVLIVVLLLPLPAVAQNLDRARALAVAGEYARARQIAWRALELTPARQDALQLYVVASCRLGDRAAASAMLERLAPEGRELARTVCSEAATLRPRERVRLPTPVYHGTSETSTPVEQPSVTPWRVAFWSATAATVVSLSVSLTFGLRAIQLKQDRDVAVERFREAHPEWTESEDVCADAATFPDAGEIQDLCHHGANARLVTGVSLGVGVGLAVASGYLYYRGYMRERSRLALRPSVSAEGGGLAVSFGF